MHNTNLWLGSQASYEAVIEAHALALTKVGGENPSPLPNLLTVQGNVGVIDIKGSLVNGSAGFMSWYGITGYGDVRDALVAAIQHPEVNAIMLNIDSPGGAVAGVHETAQLIARVDKIKPVISYTGGNQASAALWLGSSARYAYVAETGMVGSLGILMVHAEKSQQLEKEGIKVTIIRAGSDKALANPYEPLSKEAKTALEAKAATMYDIFLGHVSSQRGLSTIVADKQFGQGKEFIGKEAVAANLADATGTLEDAFTKASKDGAKIAAKKSTTLPSNAQTNTVKAAIPATLVANISEALADTVELASIPSDNAAIVEGISMPKPLTQEQLIAMAAGVTLEAVVPDETVVEPAPVPIAESTTITATLESTPNELVTYLQTQVKDLQAELLTAKMEAKTATESLAATTPQLEALASIVRNSLRTMTVALGGKAESASTVPLADLSLEHSRVVVAFKSEFKVGAVAATSTIEEPKPVTKAKVDPLFLSAVQSLSK